MAPEKEHRGFVSACPDAGQERTDEAGKLSVIKTSKIEPGSLLHMLRVKFCFVLFHFNRENHIIVVYLHALIVIVGTLA